MTRGKPSAILIELCCSPENASQVCGLYLWSIALHEMRIPVVGHFRWKHRRDAAPVCLGRSRLSSGSHKSHFRKHRCHFWGTVVMFQGPSLGLNWEGQRMVIGTWRCPGSGGRQGAVGPPVPATLSPAAGPFQAFLPAPCVASTSCSYPLCDSKQNSPSVRFLRVFLLCFHIFL